MSDLSIKFPEIRANIAANHQNYIDRFGTAFSILGGEMELARHFWMQKLAMKSRK